MNKEVMIEAQDSTVDPTGRTKEFSVFWRTGREERGDCRRAFFSHRKKALGCRRICGRLSLVVERYLYRCFLTQEWKKSRERAHIAGEVFMAFFFVGNVQRPVQAVAYCSKNLETHRERFP